MKKSSIKIDFIRRPGLPQVSTGDQLLSKNYKPKSEQGLHHRPFHGQVRKYFRFFLSLTSNSSILMNILDIRESNNGY